jgi:predicted nucleotidyltransferase
MTDDLERRLRERLEREPDVLVAYLYGSQARGRAGPLSDVDVAILLREDGDLFQRRLDLIGAVSEVTGSDAADVVLLNEIPVALGYRVLRDGKVLVSRDERARIGYFVRTVDRYLDMAPMRRALDEGMRHRLAEGRFGRA